VAISCAPAADKKSIALPFFASIDRPFKPLNLQGDTSRREMQKRGLHIMGLKICKPSLRQKSIEPVL
jgi:hypothetical protein